jgi:hypothetical protein
MLRICPFMAKTITTISAAKYSKLSKISSMISENRKSIESKENSEQKDYFSSKENALSAILPGYAVLPKVYHSIFVDPIKELFTNHFDEILQAMTTSEEGDIPFRDWLDAIQQRKDQYLKEPTHAFHSYQRSFRRMVRFGIKVWNKTARQ